MFQNSPLRLTALTLGGALLMSSALALSTSDDDYSKDKKKKAYGEKYEPQPLTDEQRAELVTLFDKAMEIAGSGTCPLQPVGECECAGDCDEDCSYEAGPGMIVSETIAKHPEALASLKPALFEAFTAKSSNDHQRAAVLDMVVVSRSKYAGEIGEKLFAEAPKHFSDNHKLAFAEYGSESTKAALAKTVKSGKASVAACAYFALEGEDIGKKTLTKCANNRKLTAENAADTLMAACALAKLGENKALGAVQERLHGVVIAALDAGQLDEARSLALTADFFRVVTKGGRPDSLSYLDWQMDEFAKKRSQEVATADQIFELIEAITPL